MSLSPNYEPSPRGALLHLAARLAAGEAFEANRASLKTQFLLAASVGDMAAAAPWAGQGRSVGGVIEDALDQKQLTAALGLLCAAARGKDVREAATALLQEAADSWADLAATGDL